MDDREFSSPVCYLDFDSVEPIPTKQDWRFCVKCQAVIVAFFSSEENSKASQGSDEFNGTKLKTSSPLETAMAQDCPMCLILFNDFPLNAVPSSTQYRRHDLKLALPRPLSILKCHSFYASSDSETYSCYRRNIQVVLSEGMTMIRLLKSAATYPSQISKASMRSSMAFQQHLVAVRKCFRNGLVIVLRFTKDVKGSQISFLRDCLI
jgi:hypothetical protein